ncbi:prenyltransferase/squalene oxidase repeat-containing protein [Parabacteroides sp. PF5-9]|uniref:prenyltransferase/squalene oxidase repeat-containing protein n=1 Tax=Parabacteroides sp. PF5-9 TaxID=1742404 RepID=UPI00247611AD|nr:prenyltransferase/squalene oxidase repeat-containing protein [Parabacteroides sp. PF5-9]MDH6358470.1 hypothetical protein [Parabacteroides sp. PF5-9]
MKETLSIKLFNTLQKGKEQLGKEALRRVLGFVESQRTTDDTFVNKNGQEDLYYTLFGWMLSYTLGLRLQLPKATAYLEKQQPDDMDLIHYAAYMRCRMLYRLFKDGKVGYLLNSIFSTSVKALNKFSGLPNNDMFSPYTQFIYLSLLEDTRQTVRNKKEFIDALDGYRVAGGGFANLEGSATATTNATVAALAVLGQLNGYKANRDVDCLRGLQEESGGFCATPGAPLPDVLSTATALFVLNAYGMEPIYSPRDFIEAHWLDSGGFSATLLESVSDVEYTFYGLLILGIL